MMRLFDIILDDPAAAAVRPALEQRISRWLVENRRQLDRWSVRFSTEANRRVMTILRAHINAEIGGLVEVAIAACGATGQTPFDQALRTLGGRVAFEPNVLARIFKEATAWTADLVRALGLGGESSDATTRWHEAEAAKMLATFYERMPAAIFANIVRLQPAEQWARRVTDDLVRTLETLVRVARVDEAERVSGLRAD
jgi:hypothetical protein